MTRKGTLLTFILTFIFFVAPNSVQAQGVAPIKSKTVVKAKPKAKKPAAKSKAKKPAAKPKAKKPAVKPKAKKPAAKPKAKKPAAKPKARKPAKAKPKAKPGKKPAKAKPDDVETRLKKLENRMARVLALLERLVKAKKRAPTVATPKPAKVAKVPAKAKKPAPVKVAKAPAKVKKPAKAKPNIYYIYKTKLKLNEGERITACIRGEVDFFPDRRQRARSWKPKGWTLRPAKVVNNGRGGANLSLRVSAKLGDIGVLTDGTLYVKKSVLLAELGEDELAEVSFLSELVFDGRDWKVCLAELVQLKKGRFVSLK